MESAPDIHRARALGMEKCIRQMAVCQSCAVPNQDGRNKDNNNESSYQIRVPCCLLILSWNLAEPKAPQAEGVPSYIIPLVEMLSKPRGRLPREKLTRFFKDQMLSLG